MPYYRIYKQDAEGRFKGIPVDGEWDDDARAIEHAKTILDGRDVEVWQGGRRVAVLKAKDE